MSEIHKKILTLSVVLGDKCNADCKFCISKLTFHASTKKCPHWWDKLKKACMVAARGGADTVIITSKREPTTAPDNELISVIQLCSEYFPIIELQTNGIKLANESYRAALMSAGLTTLAISAVSPFWEANKEAIGTNYPNLESVVPACKEMGFLTRACVIMTNRHCFDGGCLKSLIPEWKKLGFHQLTLRIMGVPEPELVRETKKANEICQWVQDNQLSEIQIQSIRTLLSNHHQLRKFPWGSEVYSVDGMSVCLAECLSDAFENDFRYAIYFPDGHLRYRWDVPEALIF